jgi:molecular chaperone Hsp33
MTDYMVRAIDEGGNIRAFVASTTAIVNEAMRRHDTGPTATAALGRTLTGTALLSATLKDPDESITVRFAGDGPIGNVTCDANEQGHVRGYVHNPHAEAEPVNGKLNVAGVVGSGYLHITRQLALQGIYTGTSDIVSGEIAEDLAHYLTTSEQTASAVALGVRVSPEGAVSAAGGVLLQLLPSASDGEREQLEVNLQALGAVSRAVEIGMSPEEILAAVLAGIPHKILERRPISFTCRCSPERAADTLATLSQDDVEHLIEQDGGAELTCHYCNEHYHFGADELRALKGTRG